MNPVTRAYFVSVAGEASRFERLVLTEDASTACEEALADVFAVERENWAEEDQPAENPFWVSEVKLIARTDVFNGSTGIIVT